MDIKEALIINQIFEDVVDAENLAHNPGRTVYPRHDVFRISDLQFIKLFRLSKNLVRELIEIVSPFVPQRISRSALNVQTIVNKIFFYNYCIYNLVFFRFLLR